VYVYTHTHKSSPGKCGAALMFFIVNRCFISQCTLQFLYKSTGFSRNLKFLWFSVLQEKKT